MIPVGILGGMGPEATLLLMQKCLDAVEATDDADHIPLIVHQNPQVPSRIKALIEGTGPDPTPALTQMARDLQAAGAGALAMPCNTAHHYSAAIRDATPLPFLDMITLTTAHLAATGARRIGMLASPAVRQGGVFTTPFAEAGLTPLYLPDDTPLLSLIRDIKSKGAGPTQAEALSTIATDLITQGADHLLIACTELSLLAHALPADTAHSDSLDCLTAAIVRTARHPLASGARDA